MPIQATVSSKGHVTYIFSDGRTVTLHGAHPYRDNNPGNLRYMGRNGLERARRHGAIGIDNTFAIFPTPEAGEAALDALIVSSGGKGLTLQQFLTKYAPGSENNLAAYLRAVTNALQATPALRLDALTADQRAILIRTMETIEGFRSRRNIYSPPVEGRQAPPR